MLQSGSKVKVLDEDVEGSIVRILKNKAIVLTDFGFEETYDLSELILAQPLDIQGVESLPKDKELKSKIKSEKKQTQENAKEIDLHIGKLVDFPRGLSNYEMLQIQLQTVREEINLARSEKRAKLIFVHGHGKGVLRKELYKLLNSYPDLEYFDASFKKYKLGATEVWLK